jgi:hypothetical protein
VADLMVHVSQRMGTKNPKLGDLKVKTEDKVSSASEAVYVALLQIDGVLGAIAVERMRVQSAHNQWETTCRRIRQQEQQR